jgi:uncharacterized protein YggE
MNSKLGTLVGGAVAGLAVVAAVALAGGGTAGAAATPSAPPTASRTITVSGEGKVTIKPNMATVQLGAQASGTSAAQALSTVNEKTAALIAALKAAGVADDDIATSGLNVYPNFDRDNRVSGFTASNSVTVKIRAIDKAGPVIDAAAAAAGDAITISGIWFGLQDQEAAIGAARTAAIENAKKRAGEYATAAGVTVGDVVQISEVGINVPMPVLYDRAAAQDSAAGAAMVPIQAGTQDLTVNVTVVYLIG